MPSLHPQMASTSKRMSDASPDVALSHIAKIAKVEPGLALSPQPYPRPPPNDFSSHVKKRLAVSSRTGQACDRCKVRSRPPPPPRAACHRVLTCFEVRKIRCDPVRPPSPSRWPPWPRNADPHRSDPKAARRAPRTARHARPPTASPAARPPAGRSRPWSRRTPTCAARWPTCRRS